MVLHSTQGSRTRIHHRDANSTNTTNSSDCVEAEAVAAAASAATAASITGGKDCGRCTAIDICVETSAVPAHFIGITESGNFVEHRRRASGAFSRHDSFSPRSSEQPLSPTGLVPLASVISGSSTLLIENRPIGCSVLHSRSAGESTTNSGCGRERLIRKLWHTWRLLAVETNQSLRRATRHARGVWHSQLFRAWRSIVALRYSNAKEGTAHLQKKRRRRFVQHSMERLQVVALLHRRQVLFAYQIAHYFLMLWHLALRLHVLRQKVRFREARVLFFFAFSSFVEWRSKSRSLTLLQGMRCQLLTRNIIFALKGWARTSMALRSLQTRHSHAFVRESFLSFRQQIRRLQALRHLAGICQRSSVKFAFGSLHTCARLRASLDRLENCSNLKLIRIAYQMLHRWAKIMPTARCMVARKVASWLSAALLGFHMQVQVARSVDSLQTCSNTRLSHRVFAAFAHYAKIEICVRSVCAQRERVVALSILQAFYEWFQNCHRLARALQRARTLQEARRLRKSFSLWRLHARWKTICLATAASVTRRMECKSKNRVLRSWHSSYSKMALAQTSFQAQQLKTLRVALDALLTWFRKALDLKKLFQQAYKLHSQKKLAACFGALSSYTQKAKVLSNAKTSVTRATMQRRTRRGMYYWQKASAIIKVAQGAISFQTNQNVELCRKVFASYAHHVQVEALVRSFSAQRETLMVWSALRALRMWVQQCHRTANILGQAKSLQEARCLRETMLPWHQHVRKKAGCSATAASVAHAAAFNRKRGTFRIWLCASQRSWIASDFFDKHQRSVLTKAFHTLRAWFQKAVRFRSLLQRAHSLHSLRHLAACFVAFNLYTRKSLLLRTMQATVARVMLEGKKRLAMRLWQKASVTMKAVLAFTKKGNLATAALHFRGMVQWTMLMRRVRQARANHRAIAAGITITGWKSAEVAFRRFRTASATLRLTARCCLWYWVRHCPMPAIFMTWRVQASQFKRERRALQFAGHRLRKLLPNVLLAWTTEISCMKGLRWHIEWQRTLRNAAVILSAWSLRTRLLAACQTRETNCNLRLLSSSVRWWRFAAVGRRAELDLQVGALRAWGLGVAQCRRIRDEILVGQWVDEVAEAFAMRRLARLTVHGFTAWSSHALAIQSLRLRLQSKHDLNLKCVTLIALRKVVALGRFAELETLLNGMSALVALKSWQSHGKGWRIASGRRLRLLGAIWSALWMLVQQRRACESLCRALTKPMYNQAIGSWCGYATWLVAAEASTRERRAKTLCAAAFEALFVCARNTAMRESLPLVLRAWRQACRVSKFSRRHDWLCGFRNWQTFCRAKWAMRRRVVVAELLDTRRRLRSVWLPWQLLCFSETPSQDVLLDRWSDAVTEPRVLRPLVTLHASNIS